MLLFSDQLSGALAGAQKTLAELYWQESRDNSLDNFISTSYKNVCACLCGVCVVCVCALAGSVVHLCVPACGSVCSTGN